MMKQTKHPQWVIIQRVTCSLQWVCAGSTAHIRLIQRLQTGLHLHLFPAYYQPEQGGASYWTHAATVETRWAEHGAYPVTVRWLCSYACRINRIGSFLVPDAYLNGFPMSAWHANWVITYIFHYQFSLFRQVDSPGAYLSYSEGIRNIKKQRKQVELLKPSLHALPTGVHRLSWGRLENL